MCNNENITRLFNLSHWLTQNRAVKPRSDVRNQSVNSFCDIFLGSFHTISRCLNDKQTRKYLLSPGTSIFPYIPRWKPRLLSTFLDLSGCNALIVSIIPFPDIFRDLDLSICSDTLVRIFSLVFPWQFISAANF